MKAQQKVFETVYYGHPLYINYESLDQVLWGRGFIDKNIYLNQQLSNQSLFTIQPKKGLFAKSEHSKPVLFGSEVLLKHSLSGHFISIKEINQIPILEFQKEQSSSCYFQFYSLRTFEGKGNPITTDSLFLIQHSQRELYISIEEQEPEQELNEPPSPLYSPKQSTLKLALQKSESEVKQKFSHENGCRTAKVLDDPSIFKRIKKKKTIVQQDYLSEDDRSPDLERVISEKKNSNKMQNYGKVDRKHSLPEHTKLEQLQQISLILYQPQEAIERCHVENYPSKPWKIQLADTCLRTPYLENNQFVYFIHSQENKVLVIDIEKKPFEMGYEKNPVEGYLSSSIFVVEIQSQTELYLKHYLTGRYFPLSKDPFQKKKFSLVPLLPEKPKQVPPFKILFDNEELTIKKNEANHKLHGFWLNKVSKKQLAEIVSFQNVSKQISLAYFINYLKSNTFNGQKLLRQCQFIYYIIEKLIPSEQDSKIIQLCYKLLFYICKNNALNKKKCVFFIDKILRESQKVLILDLLTQLLGDCSNSYVLEKAITPKLIQSQIEEFIKNGAFSIEFMRIFRVFCGPEDQTCIRNQNIIFTLFFWAEPVLNSHSMTDSSLFAQKQIQILDAYKFSFFEKEGEIYMSNTKETEKFSVWEKDNEIMSYIRQYFYLLSDCMANNNLPNIKQFTNHMSRKLLLQLLNKQKMKGPCLSLIVNGYLKPERGYKPQIFHKDYQGMCQQGSIMTMNTSSQNQGFLKFLMQQLENNKDYKSTTFRILLNAFKLTIQNGYWDSYEYLVQISENLKGIISFPQSISEHHDSYEQKVEESNLMRSKTTAISIKILLIEIQISLWVSDFVSDIYTEEEVETRIANLIKNSKDWVINESIFELCSTNSSQLMRKSLLLMYKMYNIQKLFYKLYGEACIQTKSSLDLTNIFKILHNTNFQLAIQDYFTLISACVNDLDMKKLSPQNISKNYISLQSLFKYKQVNEEVQNMMYKLGVHEKLLQDIKRYCGLRKKQKGSQFQLTYWKLLLLYAMIRNNLKLRDIISQSRHCILAMIETQQISYYVAADILEQIYRNNRKLIISDTEQLKLICYEFNKAMQPYSEINLKYCKIVNLLGVFIESGNRKIMQNHQIILKNIFTKNFISKINDQLSFKLNIQQLNAQELKPNQEKQKNKAKFKDILQILIYDLLSSMGQKKLLLQFHKPNNRTINSLLLSIGSSNWNLKSKAFSCINFQRKVSEKEPQAGKLPLQFLNLIMYDLNVMCESLQTSLDSQFKEFSKQVKIYVSNMRKIIFTINETFKYIRKNFASKLQNLQSDEVIQIIKIVERLFIMKSMCPLIVRKDIEALLEYIEHIQNRIQRNNFQYDLVNAIQIIELEDFTKKELKDKLPLIFNKKIQNKQVKGNRSLYEQSKTHVEKQVKKKIRWAKISKGNGYSSDKIKKEMTSLSKFLVCLKNVNKADPTILEDSIKQFLADFIRTSYLSEPDDKNYRIVQDILVGYEIPSVICSFLEEPFQQRYLFFSSTLQLGIKLLEDGHTQCQKKFLNYFKEDNKNRIFQNLYTIIFDSLKTIEFYYKYEEDPTIKSYEMMLEFEEVFICKEERKMSCKVLGHAFRFLQLMCQNDNQEMKNYIFNQADVDGQVKYMSKNFIEVASTILERVINLLSYNTGFIRSYPDPQFEYQLKANIFPLPNLILDFLIEVCQIPALQNQLYLCRTDFFDFIKDIKALRDQSKKQRNDFFIDYEQNIFFQMQRKIVVLLRSLLEQDSTEIITLMNKKIGKQQFQFLIQQSCVHGGLEDTEKLEQMLKNYRLNAYVQNIVDVLIVKKILKCECEFSFDEQKLKIIRELNSRIETINVDYKGHPMTVYFPSHPLFDLLKRKTKDFLLDGSANYNTRKDKITHFLLSREVVYHDINEEKNTDNKLLNENKMGYLFNFSLFLCYFIIILLLIFYSVGREGVVLDVYESQIISSLCYMQLLVAFIYAVLLGLNQRKSVSEKLKTKYRYMRTEQVDLKNYSENTHTKWKLIYSIYFGESESLHCVFLLLISLYACFFELRVYAFALLFIFAKIQFLQSIFKAIKLTWQQLIFVSFFALAFSLIFGFLTINNYIGPLYENQDIDIDINRINQHCNSIFTCVSSLYTQKIIGESVSRQDEEYNYGRFVSDIIYEAFFNIFLTNIIAAIIIDKFAEQRNVKEKVQNDRYSSCYVCFVDKATLERRGEDFYSHVNHVHSLWNYFFYMYTLQHLKDITDFTGIEYWINNQMQNNQIDWFPIDDSLKDDATTNPAKLIQNTQPKPRNRNQILKVMRDSDDYQ